MKKQNIYLCLMLISSICLLSCKQPILEDTMRQENYELYPTQNMWNFMKLDINTGQIWLVQFDVKGNARMQTPINLENLSNQEKPSFFQLYPTENMYNFMLLDKTDGRVWQVQWNFEEEYRGIWVIP